MLNFDFLPALITGFSVAAFHAALPTHWLPFVLASRSQKWTYSKTIAILLIAGIGHILTTTLLGALVVWFGVVLNLRIESALTAVSALSVFLFGSFQIYQHFKGVKHSHCQHSEPHSHDYKKSSKDGWAILSLLAMLTFSPCEAFLPVYISAWPLGWKGFFILSAILAVATLLSMVILTSLTFIGFNKLKLHWIESYEKLVVGSMLVLLSILVFFIEKWIPHTH